MKKITGQCACGNVSYRAEGDIIGVISCHCKMCQRLHGNYNPMVVVDKESFSYVSDKGLAWYASSTEARRGFCKDCGAALFKEQINGPKILISVGSLDENSSWKNIKNVFTEEAGTYYIMPEGT